MAFDEVRRWLTNKDVQFIPAFFGPNNYGHWTAVIIDNETSKEKPVVAFGDSLSDRGGRFQCVKKDFTDSPYSEKNAHHLMIDLPIQAPGSNDCAFFMIGAFTHWVLRGTKDVPKKFQFQDSYDAGRFGVEMRRHVFNSIANGEVDLEAPVLRSMELLYNL